MSIGDYFAKKMNRASKVFEKDIDEKAVADSEVIVENKSEEVVLEVVTSKVKKDKKKRKSNREDELQVEENSQAEQVGEEEVVQNDSELG